MATQLNIKDPVLIERARELARREGKPVTTTLRTIVDKAWDAQEAQQSERLARMRAFADEVYAAMPDDVKKMTSKEVMDSIYDDNEPDGFAR